MSEPTDERSNLEKLDDLQHAHPFAYNVVVGALMAVVLVLIGFSPILGAAYAVSYAALRWYLWQDGRILQRQYEARAVRWAEKQAERKRQRG